jgi:hypothetical protein
LERGLGGEVRERRALIPTLENRNGFQHMLKAVSVFQKVVRLPLSSSERGPG